MPFRCKCGRTYEKPDTFSLHTSSCAPFHQRRASLSNHVTYEALSSSTQTSSSASSASTKASISSSSLAFHNNNNNNNSNSNNSINNNNNIISEPQIIPSTSISTSSIPSSSSRRSSSIKIASPPSSLDMNFIRRRFSMNNQHYRFNPEQTSATSPDKPLFDYPIFMPTALSIQNTFEGVRRRSMSYGASLNQ
ncbi:unnamed protein product [Cunninghamella blakesleeana]